MWGLVLLVVVVAVALLLARAVHNAQQARSSMRDTSVSGRAGHTGAPPERRGTTPPPRPGSAPDDQDAFAEHVRKLRQAVADDLITSDEAVGSIVRFTNGSWSEEAAAELLRRRDAA